jgi:hypothetical protein
MLPENKQKEVHPPYSPDLAPEVVDFFLFPRPKSIMKGARFADVAVIQERDSGSAIDSYRSIC